MVPATLLDIPPEPAGIGALVAIIFLVIGFILLVAAGCSRTLVRRSGSSTRAAGRGLDWMPCRARSSSS